MAVFVRHRGEAELRATLDAVLGRYPWFAEYPVECHTECARRVIAADHGEDAADSWHVYDNARWLLTGQRGGAPPDA
jgi:hypothetical protein